MIAFKWDEAKRLTNIRKHGIDFQDVPGVFDGCTRTNEDDREAYGEQRFTTIGLLRDIVVLIAHTETADTIRIIHVRKAGKQTAQRFLASLPD